MAVNRIGDHEADLARRFLLGRLSAEESEQFDARLIGDAELFEMVEAVEDEMLDEFIRDAVSPEERLILAARFEQQPDRVNFARALNLRSNQGANQRAIHPTDLRRSLLRVPAGWAWAAAAAIVVLIGAAMFWNASISRSDTQPASKAEISYPAAPVSATATGGTEASPSSPVVAEHGPKVVAFTVALATTRGEEQPPRLELAPDVTAVALSIRLHPADRYPVYDVDVSRTDGAPVWRGRVAQSKDNQITVTIPASLLASANLHSTEYQIAVAGLDGRGKREELGEQTLTVAAHSP